MGVFFLAYLVSDIFTVLHPVKADFLNRFVRALECFLGGCARSRHAEYTSAVRLNFGAALSGSCVDDAHARHTIRVIESGDHVTFARGLRVVLGCEYDDSGGAWCVKAI